MKKKIFWLVKIHPYFDGINESTGERVVFYNWRENIADVYATNIKEAKETAALTGIEEGIHYDDIVEQSI